MKLENGLGFICLYLVYRVIKYLWKGWTEPHLTWYEEAERKRNGK